MSIFIVFIGTKGYTQDTTKVKATLKETQQWLKEKIESNGVGTWPANSYKVNFPDSCLMIIYEMGVGDVDANLKYKRNDTLNKLKIEFKYIDFEKATKKINGVGTLVVNIYGIELRFVPKDGEDFYKRFIKALKHMKSLCGGVADDKF